MKKKFTSLLLGTCNQSWRMSAVVTLLMLVLAFDAYSAPTQLPSATSLEQAPSAQTKVVKGVVTNRATKAPIIGVAVIVEGTTTGVLTDKKGAYTIKFTNAKGRKLTYRYIGMEQQTIDYTGQAEINVGLSEQNESIDGVVVTGYSTIRKEGFTGNTTRISSEELMSISPKDVISSIQVFDPSFRLADNVLMGSDPNSLPEFYIRGQNSISSDVSSVTNSADVSRQSLTSNNNLPIFILDGFEVDVEKIYDMDPNRIHSLTLLKDAAATALYGSRAANGVVVIESRSPEPGKLRVSYNFTGSVEMPDLSAYDLMDAEQKLEAEVLTGIYDINTDPTDQDSYDETIYRNIYLAKLNNVTRGVNTDWLTQKVRSTFHHKHSLYIDGGENDVRWGADFTYDNADGVMVGTGRETLGAGLTLDYRIGRFKILNRVDYDVMNSEDTPFQDFSTYSHLLPYETITDPETGKYVSDLQWSSINGSKLNPLYEAEYMNSYDRSDYSSISNNLAINYNISDDLMAKAQFSIRRKDSGSTAFMDPSSRVFESATSPADMGTLSTSKTISSSYTANVLLLYNKEIKKNFINLSSGVEFSESNTSQQSASYRGFSSGYATSVNNAMAIDGKPVNSSNKTRLASFLFLANYSYDDIYLLDGSLRYDGSSEFGQDKKVAPFWAVGAGINFHNYEFMETNPVISHLKLRASYGQTGKVNFPVYAAKSSYVSTSEKEWYMTGLGNALRYLGNDELSWEKTNTLDVGFELGLFSNKLMLRASYYDKHTQDMITSVTLPSASGFTSYMDNMGSVQNRGYEFDIRYNVLHTRDYDFTVFGNLAHNENQILEISESLKAYNDMIDDIYSDYSSNASSADFAKTHTKYVEGGSTSSIFAMRSLGINPGNGNEVYMLSDGDITYQWDAANQVIVGDTEPLAQGSFGFNARYKAFSIYTSFLYHFGGQQYNSTMVNYVENVDLSSENADMRALLMRWREPGDAAPLKDIKDMWYTTRPTSRFVQDDNVLQFNSVSLSYDFNQKFLKKYGVSMMRFTASMEDLGYWSSINRERGLSYPYSKTINFSLNLTF